MDITSPVNHISLCAGYGGIDLGLKRAIPGLRTIAFSEIEAFAVANLVAKMEAGLLDAAPIWTDLKTFPWAKFCGLVDILSGGYPCQPFSAAGLRRGKDDPRHLWPWIADGIRLCRPGLCFFENVEGHVTLGLSTVVSDLEEMGYQVSWGIFSAAEVGAPHQRKRVFIMAHDTSVGVQGYWAGRIQESFAHAGKGLSMRSGYCWPSRPSQQQFDWEPPRVVGNAAHLFRNGCDDNAGSSERCQTISESRNAGGQASVGDTESQRSAAQRTEYEGLGGELCSASASSESIVAHTNSGRLEGASSEQGRAKNVVGNDGESCQTNVGDPERAERRPDDNRITGEADKGSSDASSPDRRQTQPALGRDADGPSDWLDDAELQQSCDNRTDELRLLGNGVVPQTAEKAFLTLIGKLVEIFNAEKTSEI